ncbi:ATPase [Bisporella sp. PMI_857]|nr:ATPase [Bisporella sp. PMI_857]
MATHDDSSDVDFVSNTSSLLREKNATNDDANDGVNNKSRGSAKYFQNSSSEDNNRHDTSDNIEDGTKDSIEGHSTTGTNGPQAIVGSESSKAVNTTTNGSISSAKNLYWWKSDSDKDWAWVGKYPEDAPDAAENEETAKYALIIRYKKSWDSRKKFKAESIIIQSPWLKKALDRYVLMDYPGITCELSRLEFESPFKPFVHRWAELLKFIKRMDIDQTTKEHTTLLHDVLKREIGDNIKAFEDYFVQQVITFNHLWMLYQPGGLVVSDNDGQQAVFELQSLEYASDGEVLRLRLRCECVDWSGKYFGRRTVNINLDEFHGTKKIESLSTFPLRFHKSKNSITTELIERGRKFESLCGYHYKAYSGFGIAWNHEGREVPIHVSGRIIIDTDAFNRFSPYSARRVRTFSLKDIAMLSDYKYKHDLTSPNDDMEEVVKKSPPNSNEATWLKLTPYHQMLCTGRVRGYSLKRKRWLDFFVDFVSDITWNTDAFDHLILPEDDKDLILGFAELKVQSRDADDDVIQGKGRGVIILLHGPPGVGKTLTAEAVAEDLQVPLHSISSGDFGSNAREVESHLTNILELVARWNAILLLDECDVFLEKRSTHDLDRNRIVSIFLRTLEFYEGILFMTTNCPDNIDPAFQSRIHISMEYLPLTMMSRRHIWCNFLKLSSQGAGFSKEDLDYLASVPLNGRQIKNILKMARLLASRKKMVLNRGHVDTVLAIEQRKPDI